jgi:hypothetical protein
VHNLLNTSTIYANNEVSLAEVDIYGFDYDYTMAFYYNTLNNMIFNTARLPHRELQGLCALTKLAIHIYITLHLSHLADALIQSDLQIGAFTL